VSFYELLLLGMNSNFIGHDFVLGKYLFMWGGGEEKVLTLKKL
jgi:hypothetical protein